MNLKNINWQELEERYISGNMSMRKLAEEYGRSLSPSEMKKLQKKIEYQANKGSWKQKRMQYRAGVVNQVLDARSEDEVEQIKQMRQQERTEIQKALKITDSMINRIMKDLEQDDTSGEFLFPSMNHEQKLELLAAHSLARERYQKMLYRSYDIADRQDIRNTNVNVEYEDLMKGIAGNDPTTAPATIGTV